MALLRLALSGSSHRFHSDATSGVVEKVGILGVDISPRTVGDSHFTVVQVLLDDERPDGDRSLLSCPLVAEVTRPPAGGILDTVAAATLEESEPRLPSDPDVVASALFDHDAFRRKLKAETDAGESITRGVLVLDNGELPEPWARFAFVPIPLRVTAGLELRIYRSSVEELNSGVETAFAAGRVNEDERRNLLMSIDQHHPAVSVDVEA